MKTGRALALHVLLAIVLAVVAQLLLGPTAGLVVLLLVLAALFL